MPDHEVILLQEALSLTSRQSVTSDSVSQSPEHIFKYIPILAVLTQWVCHSCTLTMGVWSLVHALVGSLHAPLLSAHAPVVIMDMLIALGATVHLGCQCVHVCCTSTCYL